MDLKEYANMFKAIGDETRLFILKKLITNNELEDSKLEDSYCYPRLYSAYHKIYNALQNAKKEG